MKTIATHSGSFQADEVFGVAILRLLYPQAKVIRTRNPEKFGKADLRLDVGKKYNPDTQDYDHHQKEGAGKRENGITYASAGLIWKHFGKQLIDEKGCQKIDEKLIQFIDANDNGIKTYESAKASPYTIVDVIDTFNPFWNEEGNFDDAFGKAVDFAKFILQREIKSAKGMEEADKIVRKAIEESKDGIIVLEKYAPWKKIVIEETDAKYVVYPAVDGDWHVHVVPKKPESFNARKDFPEQWGGLEFEKLAEQTGVKDAVFCHRGLFICGAKSKEGAIKLAKIAVKA